MRALLGKALKFSIENLNEGAVIAILNQCKEQTLTLAINQENLQHLICSEAYSVIKALVAASTQLEKQKKRADVSVIT